jgi:aminopeptidase-like protein
MLSKRGLYPNVNTVIKNIEIKNFDNLFKIISLIDGKKNILEILNFLNISIEEFVNTVDLLYQKRLIKF